MPLRVFASGSCRILTALSDGRGKIEHFHSDLKLFKEPGHFDRLHNTKQHIQYIEWMFDKIDIPNSALKEFLSSYNNPYRVIGNISTNDRKKRMTSLFDTYDWYIFEICSTVLHKVGNYQVHYDHSKHYRENPKPGQDYAQVVQTDEEVYSDLEILIKMVPTGKPILFQCHFRPNIIYNDESKAIPRREDIYSILTRFCENNKGVYLHDPSELLQKNPTLFDGEYHFTEEGYLANFECIFQKITALNLSPC